MKKILFFLAVVTLASVVAAACGDDDGDPGPVTVSSGVGSTVSSGVGPGISISEALTSDLEGPLLINGMLHVQDDKVRLFEALVESFPPQCGGGSLVVKGLDVKTMDGLSSEDSVTWSAQALQLLGTVEGEVLTVSGTVR